MKSKSHSFTASLWRYSGAGSWFFVEIPAKLAPPVLGRFGQTAVIARVDGRAEWSTCTWRTKDGRTVLAVPKRLRGEKGQGDQVDVEFRLDASRLK